MRFEDLIDKPLSEMTDEEIEALIKELSEDQLQAFERTIKKKIRKRPVVTKAKKDREDEFNKALLS